MENDILLKLWMFFLFLLLVCFLCWGILYVEDLESQISIFGIVAIIVAAVTSVLTVTINNKKAKEREYELHILKEKQKVYEHFYNSYFEMLMGVKNGNTGLSNKVEQEMMAFKKGLMNWGSERLIEEYLSFDEKLINSEGKSGKFSIINDGNSFVKALRKDLGFDDSDNINIMSIILTAEARKKLKESGAIKD